MDHGIIQSLLIFFAIAAVVTPLCRWIGLSPILGYLVAGVVLGPAVMDVIPQGEAAHDLAELGVVVLLFMIGLELSLERLAVIRHFIFGLGTAQVLTTAGIAAAIVWWAGLKPAAAVVVGLALAFSSTAFVMPALAERNEQTSQTGRVAVAVLILQDLAVVPLLVLMPRLSGDGASILWALAEAVAKATAAMVTIFLLSRLVVRPMFRLVASSRAPEAFVATTMLVVIGTSFATAAIGLSAALGAFLAGVMLASCEYRHQIEADLVPIRGLLMGLFFLSVGMSIDLDVLVRSWPQVLLGTVAMVTVKAAVLSVLALLFRLPWAVALHVGLLLAQGGEFALVVGSAAGDAGILSSERVDLLSTVVVFAMAATPMLAAAGSWISRRHRLAEAKRLSPDGEARDLASHVILCGYGRVGRTVAAILAEADIPFVAIDRDPRRVSEARGRGEPVFFGDIRNLDVLGAVGAERARALVLTIDTGSGRETLVPRLRSRFPDVSLLVRARDLVQGRHMEEAGATAVVPEALEGSLHLAGLALQALGWPARECADVLDHWRGDDYARLAEIVHAGAP
jgi:monovalent cation:H+ antiporter-2, CPA2 family